MRRACGTRLLALSVAVLASVGAVVTGATRAGAATPPAVAAAGATEEYSVLAPLAVRTLLLDVRVVPGGGLVAVGQRGHVLLSSDGGQSWRQRLTPTRATLTAVHFADAQHGWAVGHDEVILRTTDGGETWSRAHFAPDKEQPLLAVCFADAQTGLAVGAYSTVYRSADGGATWVSAPFEPRPVKAAAAAVARDPKRDVMREDEGVAQPHLNAIVAGAGTRSTSPPRPATCTAPTMAARPGSNCPRRTRARSPACCRSMATRCSCSACAATCTAATTPG